MDDRVLAAFQDEIQKIAAAELVGQRFGFNKVASEADVLEKMAQLELAHQRGEITDLEKEAGMTLLKGMWGAARGGAKALGRMGTGMGARMGKAYSGAATGAMARGAGQLGQGVAGVQGAAKAGLRHFQQAGGLGRVGSAMKGGYKRGVVSGVRAAAKAPHKSMVNTALGAGALGLGAGAGGMAMMGGGQQQPQYYR